MGLAAVLHGPRDIRIEERTTQALGEREVRVAVHTVGVCGSDVHYYEHGRIGSFVVERPLVLGHEAAGVVVDRGARARRHEVGQRVALEPGVPCGRCRECREGRYNLCADVRFFATPPIDGAFTTTVAIHEDFAFALPPELSDDSGALLEPLSVGIWACKRGGVGPGSNVLVTGAGPIGNLALQVALAAGASEATIVDTNRERLVRSQDVGATATFDAVPSGDFEVLIECTGNADVTHSAVRALRPAGRVVLVGMGPKADIRLPLTAIQERELTVLGSFRYANTYPTAIALAASGRVQLDGLVDGRFPLADTERALQANRDDPALLKVMVDIPREG